MHLSSPKPISLNPLISPIFIKPKPIIIIKSPQQPWSSPSPSANLKPKSKPIIKKAWKWTNDGGPAPYLQLGLPSLQPAPRDIAPPAEIPLTFTIHNGTFQCRETLARVRGKLKLRAMEPPSWACVPVSCSGLSWSTTMASLHLATVIMKP